ncbi:hypothetical protein NP233_g5126 [Leucocoprinus birnbaumii]|uniref:Uncharacterized protein n=1 Tax=Leucocoprinus birnbaumii TaxID=56174 RepID=A0AAD5VW36_9AGAR|nr:hypothetical protein NP233_g5126 [Leucocoprinus birnbaumii]
MPSTKLSKKLLPVILLFSSLQLVAQVQAANDWSQPCFSGVCYYDLPKSQKGPSGTLKIWGDDHAIADITTAGGWEILGCDPNSMAQDIRIVCKNPDSSGGCSKLFDTPSTGKAQRTVPSSTLPSVSASADVATTSGSTSIQGAVGKIVRLPENCGKSAFARISKIYVPTDQSIPASIARRLLIRGGTGTKPKVKAISIDMDFQKDTAPKYGPVNFAIVGANYPGATAKGNLDTPGSNKKARRSLRRVYAKRGLGDAVDSAVNAVGDVVDDIFNNSLNVSKSIDLDPFDVDKSFNLIDQTLDCSSDLPVGGVNATVGVNGEVKVDVDAKFHSTVSLGIVASGTLLPPSFDNFGLTSDLSATLDSTITVSAGVGGDIDSGKIKLFEAGVPGLDFPGILSIGPTFQINAEGKASLDLDLDMTVGVKWTVDSAQFTFPDGGSQGGSFTPDNTPLQVTVQPSGTATGTVELHLIPSVNFGIDALAGTVSAEVFVDLDASATATLMGTATGAQQSVNLKRDALSIRGSGPIGGALFSKRTPQSDSGSSGDAGSGASFGGCLDTKAGLSVNVGATGSFFSLFDASKSIALFNKDFKLFKKCFGDASQPERRSDINPKRAIRAFTTPVSKRALKCNSGNEGVVTKLIDAVLDATQFS